MKTHSKVSRTEKIGHFFQRKHYFYIQSLIVAISIFNSVNLLGVNVKKFGAKGDGVADDTTAIQRAINAVSSQYKYKNYRLENGWYKGTQEKPVEELFFPTGKYRITRTLVAVGPQAWRGEQGSVIKQENSELDLFYGHSYRRIFMDRLTFEGGKCQLNFWSRNWNGSTISIKKCLFRNSSGSAIQSRSRIDFSTDAQWRAASKSDRQSKIISPYDVKFINGVPVLKANDLKDTIPFYSSNLINISNCEFQNCIRAFCVDNDGTLVKDTKIITNPNTVGPIMIAALGLAPNMLAIHNLHAVAVPSNKRQYWLQNNGYSLALHDSKFESHSGMLLLEQDTHRTVAWNTAGSLSVNRCSFHAAGNPSNAVIKMKRIPNILKFVDNREISKQVIPLVNWMVKPNIKLLEQDSFRGKHQGLKWDIRHKYQFIIDGNQFVSVNFPKVLRSFFHPVAQVQRTALQAIPCPGKITNPFNDELKAVDYGVKADGKTDNSPALERALKAAAKHKKGLVLPAGIIRLGSTVSLPSRIAIRGEGLSILCGDRLFGYDLLNIPEVIHVRLNNLMFSKAQHSIRAGITKQSEYLHIEDCLFYDTGKTAISIKNKNKLSDNNLQFSLLHCVFNGTGGIVSDAKLNECELNWFANNFWMDDQAFFTLNGGTLILKPGFCVPYVSKGIKRRNRITGESKIWNIGSNPRWIDNNNGKVYSFDTRFGGEGKGYCNVYNRGEKGIVYIEGGNTRFLNRYTKHCILYLEQQPEIACLVGMTGYPVRRVLGREQHVWLSETPKKTSVHICGVMVPSPH